MYFYFSSSYPSALKLNGIYFGTIHSSVKSCNITPSDLPFIEVLPLAENERQISFILDDAFLTNPPLSACVTDLDGGYLLKFNSSFITTDFKVFAQQKYSDSVITVFSENGYKLSIETAKDFYAESLEIKIDSAEIIRATQHKNLIAVYLYGEKTQFNVYCIEGKVQKIFSRVVDNAELKESLNTVETFNDMAKHKVITEWKLEGNSFGVLSRRVESSSNFDKENLNERLIPYAFLEELLVVGDYSFYLGEEIKDNADKLKGFFGEFIGVMPPPTFRDINEIGLIYPQNKNLYKVKYFKFEILNGKIANITC